MKTNLTDIQNSLKTMLKKHEGALQIRKDTNDNFEVAGTKEAMQGKKKVDGHYFASIMPKPKDIRLYYFPIYTHADQFEDIPAEVRKCLKGKSCFHIKKMSPELEEAIESMIDKGIELYKQDGLI